MSADDEHHEHLDPSFLRRERARLQKDFQAIQDFIYARQDAGELTEAQASAANDLYLETIVWDAGIKDGLGSTAIDLAVLKHANHLARAALKVMLPAHAKAIDCLESPHNR
jgi:hypothetical protein